MIVVDASMTIAWLFEDETTPDARAVLLKVVRDGGAVPSLWRLEVANTLRMAVRRKRCDETFADEAIFQLSGLPIEYDDGTLLHAWTGTWALARDEGLTVYDAAYLELAVRRKIPLATGDKGLIAAGKRCGVEVLTP